MIITKNSFKDSSIDIELDYFANRLYSEISKVLLNSPKNLQSYWEIGRILTEIDQSENRLVSKASIIKYLAIKLSSAFNKGYSELNLKTMKNFYTKFPNCDELNPNLTWSHYNILSQIKSEVKRKELFIECIENNRSSQWLRDRVLEYKLPIKILMQAFHKANQIFLYNELDSILRDTSERSLCAHMMCYLKHEIESTPFKEYFVDVEYNRNDRRVKTIIGKNLELISITCDLIVHSRGQIIEQDNLLAVEMKKSTATKEEKNKDRNRLIALTKDSYDDVWSFDGITLPEHVCGYLLGIYYEINISNRLVLLEYYKKGELWFDQTVKF